MCGSIIVIVVIAIVIISNIGRCNHHHELNFKIPQFSSPTAKSLIKDASGNHWHGGACNARQVERWIGMQWWCALVPASRFWPPPPFWQSSNSQRQRAGSAWRAGHPFKSQHIHRLRPDSNYIQNIGARHLSPPWLIVFWAAFIWRNSNLTDNHFFYCEISEIWL